MNKPTQILSTRKVWYSTMQSDFFRNPPGFIGLRCFQQVNYTLRSVTVFSQSVQVAFVMLDADGGRE